MPALLAAAVMAALAVPAAAQLQFAELAKRALPANEDRATSSAIGDVDGDGDLDLVVGCVGQSRLYLNNGTGTFTDATATNLPVAFHHTRALALGDMDGDGDLDLLVGNDWMINRLYLNNGTGTFVDATTARLPVRLANTRSLALGDVDGDGDLDLVVGSGGYPGWQNRLYLNNGTGTFRDVTATRMPGALDDTRSVALGDVDGDGDLDLVVGNWGQSLLYLNSGTGTFRDVTAARLPVGSANTVSLALGDVDGDGDLDMLLGNTGAPTGQQSLLYLNNGSGTFADATATRLPVAIGQTTSLQLGDVDGDGDLDLAVGNDGYGSGQQSRLYVNNGTGTFADATATSLPRATERTDALQFGDVDGDGDLDLVLWNYDSQSLLYLNHGAGTFADATARHLPVALDCALSLVLGDVDGDGDRDLLVGNGGVELQQSRLYRNNGAGTFTDATVGHLPPVRDKTSSLQLGDVDGDGDLDLVAVFLYASGQQARLYQNDGTGTFTDATATRMPVGVGPCTSLALGDVDGDGDLDLLVGRWNQPNLLYRNDGTGKFTDETASQMPVGSYRTRALALGDVDGDGDLDLLLGNYGYPTVGQSRLYLNNGTGTFTDATATSLPVGSYRTTSLQFGDVDGDGDLDLVLGNTGLVGAQNRLYLNNGTGTFADATGTHMPVARERTTSLALGDVDADGDLDLVVGNIGNSGYPSGHQSRVYLNNGIGTFTDATASRMPVALDATFSLLLGDVDGDGDPDLVLGNNGQSHLYLNLLRQLDAPFVLHVGRTYQLDVYSRYGPATQLEIALPFFSTATAHIPLPPIGTVGIDPNQMVLLPPFVVPQPAGLGSLVITVPNVPALAGVTIYSQALLQQIPVGIRLTNVVGDVILR